MEKKYKMTIQMSQQHIYMNGSTAKTAFNGRNFITFCDSNTSSKPSMRKEKTSLEDCVLFNDMEKGIFSLSIYVIQYKTNFM